MPIGVVTLNPSSYLIGFNSVPSCNVRQRRSDEQEFRDLKGSMAERRMIRLVLFALYLLAACALPAADISVAGGQAGLKASSLVRIIRFGDGNVRTTSLTVARHEVLAAPAREFSVVITREQATHRPRGPRPHETGERNDFSGGMRSRWRGQDFDLSRYDDTRPDAPPWEDSVPVLASSWSALAGRPIATVTRPVPGVTELSILTALAKDLMLDGVAVNLHYELYDGHPVVRKMMEVRNGGSLWLRLGGLVVDDLHLVSLTRKSLAAAIFGVEPSAIAFESPGSGYGLMAASEIPSALRTISDEGGTGYAPRRFEWVLGPGEESRKGDFSCLLPTQMTDPINKLPIPGNLMPSAQLDPVAQKILDSIPLPSPYIGRIDHQFTGNHRLSFIYFYEGLKMAPREASWCTMTHTTSVRMEIPVSTLRRSV